MLLLCGNNEAIANSENITYELKDLRTFLSNGTASEWFTGYIFDTRKQMIGDEMKRTLSKHISLERKTPDLDKCNRVTHP